MQLKRRNPWRRDNVGKWNDLYVEKISRQEHCPLTKILSKSAGKLDMNVKLNSVN